MATCEVCNENMSEVKGCNNHLYVLNNETTVTPTKVGDATDWYYEEGPDSRCGDCNALYGETHHLGCDIERCSLCHGQFISCECDYSDQIQITTD